MSVAAQYGPSDPIKLLGKGYSGIVYEGSWGEKTVAIKRVNMKKFFYKNDQAADLIRAKQQREEEIMKKLDHPNILRLFHVENDEDYKYLMLELCVGTVYGYIKGEYKGDMASKIDGMIQMASGLQYIHSQNRTVTETSESFSMSSGIKGTPIYCSPELLFLDGKTQDEIEKIRANIMVDVFSLGCLFFNYITMGGHPFADGSTPNPYLTPANIHSGKKVLNGQKGLQENHYAYAMIDGMTQAIPDSRWKLEEVLTRLQAETE